MCKAYLIRHICNHASSPRLEKCPKKIRAGDCKGVSRIEVKSPTLCSTCMAGKSSGHHRQQPAPSTTARLPVTAVEQHPAASKKVKKSYDWMNKPSQMTNPVQIQAQTSPQSKMATQPEKPKTATANDKKVKQAEARARNAAKKRDFQDALGLSVEKPATKKQKREPKPQATPKPASPTSRWDLVSDKQWKPNTRAALPSPALARTPSPWMKKPRKKAPPTQLNLQDSHVAPSRAPKQTKSSLTPKQTASPHSATTTPKSKTITSLSRLNTALASKLRALGYSPTLLHATLFSPAEIARLAGLISADAHTSSGHRRSPRLKPQAQAEAFLNKLGRQISRSGAGDEGRRVGTSTWPRGGRVAEESPNQAELDEFERVMMIESLSPAKAVWNGGRDGLFESSESEEE